MFEQSLCDSDQCEEKLDCLRYLMEERFCFNPCKIHLGNYLCTKKNNYFMKINASYPIIIKGGEEE